MPAASATRSVVEVEGNHSLKRDLPAVSAAVTAWLGEVVRPVSRR
jgi:hypothetical protein